MHRVEVLTDGSDGTFLIFTVSDLVTDFEVSNAVSPTSLYQHHQVLLRMESVYASGRIAQTVNDKSLESVGIVDDRPHAILSLQAISIQDGLLSAYLW